MFGSGNFHIMRIIIKTITPRDCAVKRIILLAKLISALPAPLLIFLINITSSSSSSSISLSLTSISSPPPPHPHQQHQHHLFLLLCLLLLLLIIIAIHNTIKSIITSNRSYVELKPILLIQHCTSTFIILFIFMMIDIEHHIVMLFDSQIVIWLHNCARHNVCQETCYNHVLKNIRIFFSF